MASAPLKRGDALVWLPPRSAGDRAFGADSRMLVIRPPQAGESLRAERVSMDGLAGTRRVRLVFDARDVTLLTPQLPALSGPKLAQALPNVVEDSLLQDVASCAVIPGPSVGGGSRLVAVIDRGWLEYAVDAFERRDMKVRSAWPAQLVLPQPEGTWGLACNGSALAVRTGPVDGLGWSVGEDPADRVPALTALLETALLASPRPSGLTAWVDDAQWGEVLREVGARFGLPVNARGFDLPEVPALDLLDGRSGASRRMLNAFDARAWRLPAGLAAACVAAALIGLNLQWAQLASEKAALRRAMEAVFRGAFPGAQVVVDPLLQMNRQVSTLRTQAGQSGPDDFLPLLARLAEALGPNGADALAGVEYRDGRLKVRFRPERVEGRALRDQLREACSTFGLSLKFEGEREPTAVVGRQG
jgi:general secretion pathway protein L